MDLPTHVEHTWDSSPSTTAASIHISPRHVASCPRAYPGSHKPTNWTLGICARQCPLVSPRSTRLTIESSPFKYWSMHTKNKWSNALEPKYSSPALRGRSFARREYQERSHVSDNLPNIFNSALGLDTASPTWGTPITRNLPPPENRYNVFQVLSRQQISTFYLAG